MDISAFRAGYKEFASEPDDYVQSKLDEAELNTSETAWGDFFDQAHGLKAAHLLWSAPFGATMRQDGDGDQQESRYSELRKQLAADVIDTSCVVTGCPRVR